MKILIADDHPLIRKRFIELIKEEFPYAKIEEASSGHEVLEKMKNKIWNIILLDVTMPGKNGMETLKRAKQLSFETPVLLFSLNNQHEYAIRAIKAGASGYLTKESSFNELVDAVKKITSGGKYITKSLARKCNIIIKLQKLSDLKPFQFN